MKTQASRKDTKSRSVAHHDLIKDALVLVWVSQKVKQHMRRQLHGHEQQQQEPWQQAAGVCKQLPSR
jgi:hypothetical protein